MNALSTTALRFVAGSAALLASACTSADVPSAYAATGDRAPVIVELFSSEGCSSCPSADAVLRDLSSSQSIAGAQVIALELHVDYWNYLGWSDPYSSAAFSMRQRKYSERGGKSGVYTPQ